MTAQGLKLLSCRGKKGEIKCWVVSSWSWACERFPPASLVTGERSATLCARKSVTRFGEKGLNFLKLCKCCRFWAGKAPGFLNECRLNYFELPCSAHSSSLSSVGPIRGDRRKQEQMSGPRRSVGSLAGRGLGSRGAQDGWEQGQGGWRWAPGFPNSWASPDLPLREGTCVLLSWWGGEGLELVGSCMWVVWRGQGGLGRCGWGEGGLRTSVELSQTWSHRMTSDNNFRSF